jgi:hypothetical protein
MRQDNRVSGRRMPAGRIKGIKTYFINLINLAKTAPIGICTLICVGYGQITHDFRGMGGFSVTGLFFIYMNHNSARIFLLPANISCIHPIAGLDIRKQERNVFERIFKLYIMIILPDHIPGVADFKGKIADVAC